MYSLRHVFWRGAMALSLLTVGVGGGLGFQQAPAQAQAPACEGNAHRLGDAPAPLIVGGVRVQSTRVDGRALAVVAVQARKRG